MKASDKRQDLTGLNCETILSREGYGSSNIPQDGDSLDPCFGKGGIYATDSPIRSEGKGGSPLQTTNLPNT